MSKMLYGVIETSSGNLKRFGFCSVFATDGSFNSGTETVVENVPYGSKVFSDDRYTEFSRLTDSIWGMVDK